MRRQKFEWTLQDDACGFHLTQQRQAIILRFSQTQDPLLQALSAWHCLDDEMGAKPSHRLQGAEFPQGQFSFPGAVCDTPFSLLQPRIGDGRERFCVFHDMHTPGEAKKFCRLTFGLVDAANPQAPNGGTQWTLGIDTTLGIDPWYEQRLPAHSTLIARGTLLEDRFASERSTAEGVFGVSHRGPAVQLREAKAVVSAPGVGTQCRVFRLVPDSMHLTFGYADMIEPGTPLVMINLMSHLQTS